MYNGKKNIWSITSSYRIKGVSEIMARNNSVQVFKGGWEELENAIFTDNETAIALSLSFTIKPDGTELYLITNSNVVETYPLAIPYDPNSIGTLIRSFPITDDTQPMGIIFKDDGTKMFVGGVNSAIMLEYAVPTPFDTDSIVASPVQISLSVITGNLTQIDFSKDGDFFFVTDLDNVYSFPLPTPWDITSNTSNTSFNPATVGSILSITFKREGDKMYLLEIPSVRVVEFDLSTPYDITTANPNGNELDLSSMFIFDMKFRSNGLEFFAIDTDPNFVRFHLDEQWNISTASLFTNSAAIVDIQSIIWKPDGLKFFTLVSSAADRIDEHTMITNPWNQTSALITDAFVLTPIAAAPRGMWVSEDGTVCFITDNSTNSLIQLNMSTGWSLSTMTNPGITKLLTDLVPALTNPTGIAVTKDEKTYYITDSTTDTVYQFTSVTPLDIVNMTYTGNSLAISGDPTDIQLKPDDKLMLVCERSGDTILLYRLPADGNVQQAVLLQTLPVGFLELNLQAFFVRENDGGKIWVGGLQSGLLRSMDMSAEFNNSLITEFGDDLVTDLGENLVYV